MNPWALTLLSFPFCLRFNVPASPLLMASRFLLNAPRDKDRRRNRFAYPAAVDGGCGLRKLYEFLRPVSERTRPSVLYPKFCTISVPNMLRASTQSLVNAVHLTARVFRPPDSPRRPSVL